jgi:uncharacterized Zn-finger protein
MVLKRADHPHSHLKGTYYIELTCAFCGNKFERDIRNVSTKIKNGQKDFYCNRSCMAKDFGAGRPKK